MIDLDVVKKHGGTPEALKKLFTEGPKTGKQDEDLKPLYNRINSRIKEGITYNIRNYKLFYALDLAWNTPLRQSSYTLLQSLVNKKADTEEVKRAVQDWGLSNLVVMDGKSKTVNIPVFFEIFIPLVRAYLTIRWAKIVNDRKNYPFFKYEAQRQSKETRVKAEVITDRVQLITQQYDYLSDLKQSVFQMLHYGFCLQFPRESWHSEKQLDASDKEVYVREGIRYHMPHPTRCFVDLAHRLSTINSDSGIRFLGYWTIRRWREIRNNTDWWNKDKVSLGSVDWIAKYPNFFNTSGAACTTSMPSNVNVTVPGIADREKEIGFYTTDLDDTGVLYTEYFEKLNPKQEGLFDYDYEIWMRFVVASDDTILFAEPLPYSPAIYYGYDSNENQSMNSSLSLEILPSQDMISNLLTQYVLSVKQNLANLNLLDKDALCEKEEDATDILGKLENLGEKWFRSLNFRWFSSRRSRVSQTEIKQAVQSFRFTPLPTDGLISAIRQILDLLERSLVMSSQEVAAAATHEQTAEEVKVTSRATSTRLEFTATPVDQAMYAWKKQLYDGLMAYGEPEFYAQISHKVDQKELEAMGFTVEDKWSDETRRMTLKAKSKTAISLESFASTRDGEDRISNGAIAAAMSQVLTAVLSNPELMNAIGDDQAVELLNLINQYLGLPDDFKLRNVGGGLPPQQKLMQVIQAVQKEILGQVGEGMKPVVQSIAGVERNIQSLAAQTQDNSQKLQQQAQLTAKLAAIVQAAATGPLTPPPPNADIQFPPPDSQPAAPGQAMAGAPVSPPGPPMPA